MRLNAIEQSHFARNHLLCGTVGISFDESTDKTSQLTSSTARARTKNIEKRISIAVCYVVPLDAICVEAGAFMVAQ